MQAIDNDPGSSGLVTCFSSHPSFKTDNFGEYYAIFMNGSLDREQAEKMSVTLVCNDAGSPPKTSSLTFQVIVADINDNAPVFSRTQYVANITEENIVGKQILKVITLTVSFVYNPLGRRSLCLLNIPRATLHLEYFSNLSYNGWPGWLSG